MTWQMSVPQLQGISDRNMNSSWEVEWLIFCSSAKTHTWEEHTWSKNLSDVSNSQTPIINLLSSSGKKINRQTPKLPMHLQWFIWLLVTFVWHNLHGIHTLLFVLWCCEPANLQREKPSDSHRNPAGRKLARLCFSSLVRMHKPGCSYARMEVTRAGHTNIKRTSTRSLWNTPYPKEGVSRIPCSMRDCVRQWGRRSCLLDQKITARFPNVSISTSIQCVHLL